MTAYDVVVLAGGGSRRMGGTDKTRLDVGGATLLDRVLAATSHAHCVVVVGPERPVAVPVRWTREQPPGGGPPAAVAAGLAQVDADVVVLVAADLPLLTAEYVDSLVSAIGDSDGAVPVDDAGEHQWLCSAWRTSAIRSADLSGSLRRALAGLSFVAVATGPGPGPWTDCDTPDELRQVRELT